MSMLRIDYVSTPFAGHLHPLLEMAGGLGREFPLEARVISTNAASAAVERAQLPFVRVLEGRDETISGIANASRQVGSNPFRLLEQVRENLSMMDQLVSELKTLWRSQQPDLVIVDFAVPVAGLLAQSLGIAWWTSLTSLPALETPDGTPTYLGGWRPREGLYGSVRDALGRSVVRNFKRGVFGLYRRDLQKLGIRSIYRDDGYERIYSDELILGLWPRELEFARTLPPHLRFLGPMTSCPPFPHEAPTFVAGKPHVLVSLGTHIRWAGERARQSIRTLAQRMPDVEFHLSRGATDAAQLVRVDNYAEYSYLPYDIYMGQYAASINHAGTGVLCSCLRRGVPVLGWPHDFDQFDHAARIEHFGLGRRVNGNVTDMQRDLELVLYDEDLRARVRACQETISGYRPLESLAQLVREKFGLES